jgi:hypothetical protein
LKQLCEPNNFADFIPASKAGILMTRENAMTKARDDKGAETKANARATTRAVARTKASEPMAKTNEDEMAEATNGHSTEIRKML